MDSSDCTKGLVEFGETGTSGLKTQGVAFFLLFPEEPWVTFDLLGEETVLANGVYNQWVLLTFLLE